MNCVNILNLRFPRGPCKTMVFFKNKKLQTNKQIKKPKNPATNSHIQQNTAYLTSWQTWEKYFLIEGKEIFSSV